MTKKIAMMLKKTGILILLVLFINPVIARSETVFWGPNLFTVSWETIVDELIDEYTGIQIPSYRMNGTWDPQVINPITGSPMQQPAFNGNWYTIFPTNIPQALSLILVNPQPAPMKSPEIGDNYIINLSIPDGEEILTALASLGPMPVNMDGIDGEYDINVANTPPVAGDVLIDTFIASVNILPNASLKFSGSLIVLDGNLNVSGSLLSDSSYSPNSLTEDLALSSLLQMSDLNPAAYDENGAVYNFSTIRLNNALVSVDSYYNFSEAFTNISAGNSGLHSDSDIQNDGTIRIADSGSLTVSVKNAYGDDGARIAGIGTFENNGNIYIGNNAALIIREELNYYDYGLLGSLNIEGGRIEGAGHPEGDGFINHNGDIRGYGQLGVNSLSFINKGLVSADVSGKSLTIDPNDGGFVNEGVLEAINGGKLVLQSGDFDNKFGSIAAQAGSSIDLIGVNLDNKDGSVVVTGNGMITLTDSKIYGGILDSGDLGSISHYSAITLDDVELAGDFTQLNKVYYSRFGEVGIETKTFIIDELMNTGAFNLHAVV